MTPTARIGLLTVVSVDGNKCACVCDCGASVVRSVQVLRRAKGLAAQSSCLTAAQEWHVIFDGCFYVANCPSLRLTTMSETYDELPEMISDILQHLLRGLLRSGELETFLQKHGWEKHGPANWRNYAMPRPTRLNGEINRLRILVSDLRKANGECGDRVVAALDRAIDAEAEADRLRAELAELRDRVQSVIERGPRFMDGPMESAADSVVEELRAVLTNEVKAELLRPSGYLR